MIWKIRNKRQEKKKSCFYLRYFLLFRTKNAIRDNYFTETEEGYASLQEEFQKYIGVHSFIEICL